MKLYSLFSKYVQTYISVCVYVCICVRFVPLCQRIDVPRVRLPVRGFSLFTPVPGDRARDRRNRSTRERPQSAVFVRGTPPTAEIRDGKKTYGRTTITVATLRGVLCFIFSLTHAQSLRTIVVRVSARAMLVAFRRLIRERTPETRVPTTPPEQRTDARTHHNCTVACRRFGVAPRRKPDDSS